MEPSHLEANRANWDARVPVHLGSQMYSVEELVNDPERVTGVVRFDAARLGDVTGLRLLHLQCHIGTDTISWARLGAEVTGLDFSPKAIGAARKLAEQAGLAARFLCADVHDAVETLDGEQFDLVYASVGVLSWIPDVTRWMAVASRLVGPGGRLYLRDDHPILRALDEDRDDELLVLSRPYFEVPEPTGIAAQETYTDGDSRLSATTVFEWSHGLASILQAVIDAGLRIERVDEHAAAHWPALPGMVPGGEGRLELPGRRRDVVPLEFSVTAQRPVDPS
jgi:SAM-dependent methyltransferase